MGARVDQDEDSLYVQELFAASLNFQGPFRNASHPLLSEVGAKEAVELVIFGYLAPFVICGS